MSTLTAVRGKYKPLPGPEAFLAPAAAILGVVLPDAGSALVEGEIVPTDTAIDLIARKLAEAKKPAVCPGPLVLWQCYENAAPKAAALKALAEACGAKILPMADYRAKRINAEIEISPNHPNVTIMHNEIDVCLFAGMHSHFANFSLRLIRGGTSCYTIALCEHAASDEAMVSLRDVDVKIISAITEKVRALKR